MKRQSQLLARALCLLTLSSPAPAEAPRSGGRTPSASPEVTEERRAVFDRATEGLPGVDYALAACLGSQVVAGVNHCFLGQATPVAPDARPGYALVCLYEDLEGSAQILSIADLDVGARCEY